MDRGHTRGSYRRACGALEQVKDVARRAQELLPGHGEADAAAFADEKLLELLLEGCIATVSVGWLMCSALAAPVIDPLSAMAAK